MPVTRVVNLNKEGFDIRIDRGSKWGNPYTHIKDKKTKAQFIVGTREEAIQKYRVYILSNPKLLADLHELEGKILGCHCKPDTCHGDILIELISQQRLLAFFQ